LRPPVTRAGEPPAAATPLLVAGGWLAALRATVHIDLQQRAAAEAHLKAAFDLANHAEYSEI
jgi:hypothetical protein